MAAIVNPQTSVNPIKRVDFILCITFLPDDQSNHHQKPIFNYLLPLRELEELLLRLEPELLDLEPDELDPELELPDELLPRTVLPDERLVELLRDEEGL
ncbi:hypothetical protein EH223_17735 [candidate division KSB1 bacterium]|nr:MAG: hypothetical protein EH223_17735 [candidate division KSB1 bacterium]